MKTILIIVICVFTLCKEENGLLGGWNRHSFINKEYKDIDGDIVNAYNYAFELHSTDINYKIDNIIPLIAYTQVINGTNYNITFIDRKDEYPVIYEYDFYSPLSSEEGKKKFELCNKEVFEAELGLSSFEEKDFSIIELQLYRLLKKINKKLNYISYFYPVQDKNTVFFIIGADVDGDLCLCVMGQEKKTNNFDLFKVIKYL